MTGEGRIERSDGPPVTPPPPQGGAEPAPAASTQATEPDDDWFGRCVCGHHYDLHRRRGCWIESCSCRLTRRAARKVAHDTFLDRVRSVPAHAGPSVRSLVSIRGRWMWNPLRLTRADVHVIEVAVAANLISASVIGLAIAAARSIGVVGLVVQVPIGLLYCFLGLGLGDFDDEESRRPLLRRRSARLLVSIGYLQVAYSLLALVGKAAGVG